jgi:hypothetical protein
MIHSKKHCIATIASQKSQVCYYKTNFAIQTLHLKKLHFNYRIARNAKSIILSFTCFPPFHLQVQTSGQSSATGDPSPTIRHETNNTKRQAIFKFFAESSSKWNCLKLSSDVLFNHRLNVIVSSFKAIFNYFPESFSKCNS